MTPDETRFLLARVSHAWGRRPPNIEIVQEWTRGLAGFDAGVAHEALDRLIAEGTTAGPNLPQLIAMIRACQPHYDNTATPEWSGPTDTGRDAIARIRAEHGWVKT